MQSAIVEAFKSILPPDTSPEGSSATAATSASAPASTTAATLASAPDKVSVPASSKAATSVAAAVPNVQSALHSPTETPLLQRGSGTSTLHDSLQTPQLQPDLPATAQPPIMSEPHAEQNRPMAAPQVALASPKPGRPEHRTAPVSISAAAGALQQRLSHGKSHGAVPVKAVPDMSAQSVTDSMSKPPMMIDQTSAQSGSPGRPAFSHPPATAATSNVPLDALSRAAPAAGLTPTISALSTPDAITRTGGTPLNTPAAGASGVQAPSPSAARSAPSNIALSGPVNRQADVASPSFQKHSSTKSLQVATAPIGSSAPLPALQKFSHAVPATAPAALSATETASQPPSGDSDLATLLGPANAVGQTTTKPTHAVSMASDLSKRPPGSLLLAASLPLSVPSTTALQSIGIATCASLAVHVGRHSPAAGSSAALQATASTTAQAAPAVVQSLPSPTRPAVEAIQKPVSQTAVDPFSRPTVQTVPEPSAWTVPAVESSWTTPRPAPRALAANSHPASLPANLTAVPIPPSSSGTAFGASPAHIDTRTMPSLAPATLAPATLAPATLAPGTASPGSAFQLPAFQLPANVKAGMPAAEATPPSLSFAALPASPSLFSPAQATAPTKKTPGMASKKKKRKAQKQEAQAVSCQGPTPSSSKQLPASSSLAPAASAPGPSSSHLLAGGAAKRRPADPTPDPPNPKRHHPGPQSNPREFISPELTAMRTAHGWSAIPMVGSNAVQPQLKGIKSLVTSGRYMYSLPDIVNAIGEFAIGHERQLEIFLGDLHNSRHHQQQVSLALHADQWLYGLWS